MLSLVDSLTTDRASVLPGTGFPEKPKEGFFANGNTVPQSLTRVHQWSERHAPRAAITTTSLGQQSDRM